MSDLADITAAILAGGFGSRLKSVVADRPKALAEVCGRPFLVYLLDTLASAGVQRAVICTGYRAEMIEDAIGSSHGPMELTYSREQTPLGTGGALRQALPCLESKTILALNGDSLCRADLPAFVASHAQRGAAVSLLLAHIDDTSRYGRVHFDDDGCIRDFIEKGAQRGPGWINAGIYLIERRVLESLDPDSNISLERTVFPRRIGRGLYGHPGGRQFLDIGTPASYAAAAAFLLDPDSFHFTRSHAM